MAYNMDGTSLYLVNGHNVLYCAKIYKSCAQDIISGSVNSTINNYVHSLVEDCQLQAACFVHELILIRDSALELTNDVQPSREELDTCIQLLRSERMA